MEIKCCLTSKGKDLLKFNVQLYLTFERVCYMVFLRLPLC